MRSQPIRTWRGPVIGVPHQRWGEDRESDRPVAAGAEVDQDDVISFVRQRLAGFQVSDSVDVVATLPRTATGKVPTCAA